MEVKLVKAELFIVINFNMSCDDFVNYAKLHYLNYTKYLIY